MHKSHLFIFSNRTEGKGNGRDFMVKKERIENCNQDMILKRGKENRGGPILGTLIAYKG